MALGQALLKNGCDRTLGASPQFYLNFIPMSEASDFGCPERT
jgi:hypothetical protein